jgi:hypothetical protein
MRRPAEYPGRKNGEAIASTPHGGKDMPPAHGVRQGCTRGQVSESAMMRKDLLQNRDVLSGILFVALGATTLLYARRYPLGTLTDMGPGYFPAILGGALVVFGAIAASSSLLRAQFARVPHVALRPLLAIALCPVCFALLLDRIGLPLSVFCASMLACAARPGFLRPWAVLLSVVLAVISVLVFAVALSVPLRLWPAAWQGF